MKKESVLPLPFFLYHNTTPLLFLHFASVKLQCKREFNWNKERKTRHRYYCCSLCPFVQWKGNEESEARFSFNKRQSEEQQWNEKWRRERRAFFARFSFFTVHSSLFFIYWIKTKEKGVRSLTLFPLVFYSIKEQQRTSVKSKNKRKQMSACFALFTCFFSLCWKWSVKKGRGAHSTCPLLSSFHFIFNTTPSFPFLSVNFQWSET